MRLVLKLAVYAAALWVAVQVVSGLDFTGSWVALVGVAVVFAVVNSLVKPVIKLLSLPLVLLTLGLFLLVVNAMMLGLTIWLAAALDLGITSTGFGPTFLGAVIVSIVTWAGESLVLKD